MLINQSNLSFLFTGLSAALEAAFLKVDSYADKWSLFIPNSTEVLSVPWTQVVPKMRQWTGDRQINNAVLQSINITNLDWEDTLEIPRPKIEDDQYGVYSQMIIPALAREAKIMPDRQLVTVLEANGNAYDGVTMFSSARLVDPSGGVSGTQTSNDLTATGGLTATTLAAAMAALRNQKGPDGEPLGLEPKVLMVPSSLEFAAKQLVNASFFPMTIGASNFGSGQNVVFNSLTVVVNPFLTDPGVATAKWYLLAEPSQLPAMIWSDRSPLEIQQMVDPSAYTVFMKNVFTLGLRRRGAPALGIPMAIIRNTNA